MEVLNLLTMNQFLKNSPKILQNPNKSQIFTDGEGTTLRHKWDKLGYEGGGRYTEDSGLLFQVRLSYNFKFD